MGDGENKSWLLLGIDVVDAEWRLRLGEPGTRPTAGVLPASAVAALQQQISALLRPRPGVAIRGRDLALSQREEQVGQTLAAALRLAGLSERLAHGLGRGCRVLAVDGAHDAVRSLPWELLSGTPQAPPLVERGVLVCRLVPGEVAPVSPSGTALRIRLWAPDAEEPRCAGQILALRAEAASAGIAVVALDDPAQEGPEILHIVCHGHLQARAVGLAIGGALQSAGTISQRLSGVLRSCSAVVLEVCQAASGSAEESRALAARLVAAGAPACFAPVRPLSTAASSCFSSGLYTALAGGADLRAAAEAARRSVVALALPRLDARWHVMALSVADLSVLLRPAPVSRSALAGWPAPGADAATLIDGLVAASARLDSGFFGIEHLIEAICAQPPGSTLAHLRAVLVPRLDEVRQGLAARVRLPERSATLSPRLQDIGARLSEGFSREQLIALTWPAICVQLGLDVRMHAGGESTLELGALTSTPTQAPVALEVVSGPEDGRHLAVIPGAVVGRFSDTVHIPHALYAGTAVHDPYLSRQHLIWHGAGRITLARPGLCGGVRVPAGEHLARVGEVLALTPGTRLRVC